jgi:hypothetical protein
MEQKQEYKFPVGDFLSGFSDDEKNPCDYELECQRMVIRGVQYLDENPNIYDLIFNETIGIRDERLRPMLDYMCLHEENPEESDGQTGAMVDHTVRHSFHAKNLGWNEYIKNITEQEIVNNK